MKSDKAKFDYSDVDHVLMGRQVNIGLKSNYTLSGEVRFLDEDIMVLVVEPTSILDIEAKIHHTIVDRDDIAYIQFKSDRSK